MYKNCVVVPFKQSSARKARESEGHHQFHPNSLVHPISLCFNCFQDKRQQPLNAQKQKLFHIIQQLNITFLLSLKIRIIK